MPRLTLNALITLASRRLTAFTSGLNSLSSLFDPTDPPDELSPDSAGQSIQEIITTKGVSFVIDGFKEFVGKVRGWVEVVGGKIMGFDLKVKCRR